MKCKYRKKCELYNKESYVCNYNQYKSDNYPYCGYFREMQVLNSNKYFNLQ